MLDGLTLLLGQGDGLVPHEQGNCAQRQDQRRDREQDDFCLSFIDSMGQFYVESVIRAYVVVRRRVRSAALVRAFRVANTA
ncbi:hypothetical protein LP420_06365 [Massilia sp. B-10]|nr:hypothetical protein LP420_06365 [Massilia sp. B-10]